MKKTVLFITTVLILATSAFAEPVSTAFASRVAANFWAAHRPAGVPANITPKSLEFSNLNQLHIFDMEGKGFVIVAADDRVQPILAYSFSNPFPNSLNPNIAYWLQGYNDQIEEAVSNNYRQRESTLQEWGSLILKDVVSKSDDATTTDLTAVPVMLTTQWDQSDPYNILCPYDSVYHGRTVVGCVATAMAQVTKTPTPTNPTACGTTEARLPSLPTLPTPHISGTLCPNVLKASASAMRKRPLPPFHTIVAWPWT